MNERVSALMDGELPAEESAGVLDALRAEGESREDWRRYHLIGDLMRGSQVLSAGFAARVAERIGEEPTVLAPVRRQGRPAQMPLWALSAAASLAAVAFVGWMAFAPSDDRPLAVHPPQAPVVAQEAPRVAPPAAASEYLLAHQSYSPRNSLQGVAPYVRTVAGEPRGPMR